MRTRFIDRRHALVVALWCGILCSGAGAQQAATTAQGAQSVGGLLKQAHQQAKSAKSLDEFTAALRTCSSVIKSNPSEQQKTYVYQLAGWTYNKRGETLVKLAEDTTLTDQKRANEYEQAAVRDFELAMRFDPKNWKPRFNHAVSVAILGRYQDALADLDFVIREQPKHRNALFNRAEILLQMEQYDRAVADYTSTLEIDPNDGAALAGRGIALSALGDTEAAMLDLNAVVRLKPDSADAYIDRADLYAALGNWERAAGDYRVAIGLDNTKGRAYQNVAWLMATCPEARFRNPALAVRAAKKAIELEGQTYLALDTYAAALAANQQYPQAAQIQRKALAAAPGNEQADLQGRLALYQKSQPYHETPGTKSQVQFASAEEDVLK